MPVVKRFDGWRVIETKACQGRIWVRLEFPAGKGSRYWRCVTPQEYLAGMTCQYVPRPSVAGPPPVAHAAL